jgi:hypothetical protein
MPKLRTHWRNIEEMEGRDTGGMINERAQIAELRRLLETAKLPWHIDEGRRPDDRYTWLYDAIGVLIGGTSGRITVGNAELIVAAVNALPALLHEVERLRGIQ